MKVGSIVICIDDLFTNKQLLQLVNIPREGDYYTIRDIVEYPNLNRIGLRLEEISNPPVEIDDNLHEPTFNVRRFAEVDIPPSFEEELNKVLDNELELVEIKK
jgi:hypothetical protein